MFPDFLFKMEELVSQPSLDPLLYQQRRLWKHLKVPADLCSRGHKAQGEQCVVGKYDYQATWYMLWGTQRSGHAHTL